LAQFPNEINDCLTQGHLTSFLSTCRWMYLTDVLVSSDSLYLWGHPMFN